MFSAHMFSAAVLSNNLGQTGSFSHALLTFSGHAATAIHSGILTSFIRYRSDWLIRE